MKFYLLYGGFEEKIFRNIQLHELESAQEAQKKLSFENLIKWFKIYLARDSLISMDYLNFHLLSFKIRAKQYISFLHINGSESKDSTQKKAILQAHGFHTLLSLD